MNQLLLKLPGLFFVLLFNYPTAFAEAIARAIASFRAVVSVVAPEMPSTSVACASDRPLSEAAQRYVDFIVPRFKKDIFGNR